MIRRIAAALFIAAILAGPARAQIVRGSITEVNSATPVVGALVSLLGETSDSTLASVLTTRAGDYAVRAPGVGTYRLAVKRIGVQRFVSVPFALGSGETKVLDVPMAALAMTLPEVNVSGLCVTHQRDLRRIASLWDEARTALEATEISLRDRLIDAGISRYAAELDPGSLRVLFDWRSDVQLMVQQPFTSISGDSLSAVGYWRQLAGDSVEYLAPDARALASNAFIRDHCFSVAGTARGRPGLTGLAFVPASTRSLPDIMGTIWIDARTLELRFIEFRYTRLPTMPNANRVGGEVHFARLNSGAWIVERWFIRMPQVIIVSDAILPRRQLREEGGAVISSDVAAATRFASVTGMIRDSTGRPLGGAVVRALGTHRQVVSGEDGSFALDSLPPVALSIVVHTVGYDSFGVLAATRRVDLERSRTQRVDLRAPNSSGIRREVCPAPSAGYIRRENGRGALRVMMVDSATSVPIPGVRLLASWPAISENPSAPADQERYRQALTDSRGVATFCDLPAGVAIELSLSSGLQDRSHVMMVQPEREGIIGRVVMVRVNR
jgi:hypothetical protein